jgi:hypothetical protein
MGGRTLRGVIVALALLAVPMMGCELRRVQLQLPGFGNGQVEGLWLWKQVNGEWTRVCRIDFTDRRITEQGETLFYVQNCVKGQVRRAVVLPAPVDRPPGDPMTINVELIYLRYEPPGTYRATAFNAFGESALSATSSTL